LLPLPPPLSRLFLALLCPALPSLPSLSFRFTNASFFLLIFYILSNLINFLQFGSFFPFLSALPSLLFISLLFPISSPFPHSTSYSMGTVRIFLVLRRSGPQVSQCLHLPPKLRICSVIPPCLHTPPCVPFIFLLLFCSLTLVCTFIFC
jgi:hypothetical protein